MNSSQNSQESKRPSISSSSSHPTSEDVEPVSVTSAFNRGTQTPADFNNVRVPTQNNQNVNDAQEEVKNEPKKESHKRSKMEPLAQEQKDLLDAILKYDVSKRRKVESNSSNALNAAQPQPQPECPNVMSPVSQPQSAIQINTCSEKEVVPPRRCSSVFEREPANRVPFAPGQDFKDLCSSIPKAYREGPLRAAGFYAEWLQCQKQVEESEHEMRLQFDEAVRAFAQQLDLHLRDICVASESLRDLSLEELLQRFYGVESFPEVPSQGEGSNQDEKEPMGKNDKNGRK